ncbi:aminotransferase class V [Reticulibacter mediterranei]|uniref:Aminotransferase class V n=1 Tax=Reticulibacter mediterranei TaxID=2778369 RepID=A0A8J3N6J5_9CHLR|nr:aminotransferase class V-fold PLP-dependent enzyme [Reticulibacter mediterranei]GHO97465.1 aminotransferase class V [Reticulibacter mediterranei]
MEFDLHRARLDTPGCEHVIHLNNAGASLMPKQVLNAITAHLQLEALIGGYEAAEQRNNAIERVYDLAACLLNCQRDEIAVTENATRAWDMAFYSISFQRGDRILTSRAEYASNYIAFLQIAQKYGVEITVIPNDDHDQISLEALYNAIDKHVKLLAITHVPMSHGLINPAAAIGRIARQAGILYLLDACQSVGQMPIDVEQINCDLLSVAGRKYLRGPRGTGLLYVRKSVLDQLEPPILGLDAARWISKDCYQLAPDAGRFESWEVNCASKIGLATAIDYALQWGIDAIWSRITSLASMLRARLRTLPRVVVQDQGTEQCGIVSFTIAGKDPMEIRQILAKHRINVWVPLLSSNRLDMEPRGLSSLIRTSVHYYNSHEEINQLCEVLEAATTDHKYAFNQYPLHRSDI